MRIFICKQHINQQWPILEDTIVKNVFYQGLHVHLWFWKAYLHVEYGHMLLMLAFCYYSKSYSILFLFTLFINESLWHFSLSVFKSGFTFCQYFMNNFILTFIAFMFVLFILKFNLTIFSPFILRIIFLLCPLIFLCVKF